MAIQPNDMLIIRMVYLNRLTYLSSENFFECLFRCHTTYNLPKGSNNIPIAHNIIDNVTIIQSVLQYMSNMIQPCKDKKGL
jgi:hypothetical protein